MNRRALRVKRDVLAMPIDVKTLRGTSILCLSLGELIWYPE